MGRVGFFLHQIASPGLIRGTGVPSLHGMGSPQIFGKNRNCPRVPLMGTGEAI